MALWYGDPMWVASWVRHAKGGKNTVHYFESVEGKKTGYFSSLEDKKRGRVEKKEHGTEALNMVHIHSKINLIYYIKTIYYWGR